MSLLSAPSLLSSGLILPLFFFLPGASPPTQPHSDEVNNQGVSFKYKLAQSENLLAKERKKKKKYT